MNLDEQTEFSNKLNDYCRFERDDLDGELESVLSHLEERIRNESDYDFEIVASTVKSYFGKVNVRKATGPDSITGKLLKMCASELCDVYCKIFNWSLNECCVPSAWINSLICPVPKNKSPSTLNDFRPIALTSVVMKCFEKIVLRQLLHFTRQRLDPLHFAYKPSRSIDDAILTLLHNAFIRLDKPGSFVRILFY